ncbi:MAG: fumarylacetoacetate hydrolase family protein, partial [Hyphomicrobiaceae bacterium]
MKLASLKGGRDGRLVVVSRDLTRAASADPVAHTMQQALDDWGRAEPRLRELAESLERGAVAAGRFRERETASPLPRAYQWVDGSAYLNHVELVRKARGVEVPRSFFTDPLMYQGGSDILLGARDQVVLADEAWGIDCEAEVAVVVDDVPMGVDPVKARDHIKLVMLVNDISLRNLTGPELAKGFGFLQSKPPTVFSPVAVTPDELGDAWRDGKLHLPLLTSLSGKPFGRPNAGNDMTFDFGRLIAHAAMTRPLSAGTIVGSGTVSNKGPDGGPGQPVAKGGLGYSCIAEVRTVETLLDGRPTTPFLKFG